MSVPKQESTKPYDLSSVLRKGLRDAVHESPVSRVLRLATKPAASSLEQIVDDHAHDAVEKSEGVGGVTEGEGSPGGDSAAGPSEVIDEIADEEAANENQ